MRKKRTPSPKPAPVTVFDTPRQDVDNDNSKWSWLRSSKEDPVTKVMFSHFRSGDKSAGKARFSLSIYW